MPLWRVAVFRTLQFLFYWQMSYAGGYSYLIVVVLFQARLEARIVVVLIA